MELVIGGFGQGKLRYVINKLNQENKNFIVVDETNVQKNFLISPAPADQEADVWIINHVHWIIRSMEKEFAEAEDGKQAEASLSGEAGNQFLLWKDSLTETVGADRLIFISDEVGCGVVPLDPADRRYREEVGRVLCELAKQAEHVERIVCGLPQKIK